jgi:hypothetical protein
VLGLDQYKIVRENLEYPRMVGLIHYKNIKAWSDHTLSSIGADIGKDLRAWEERGITERIWYPAYTLIKNFRSNTSLSSAYETTMIENAPIMYLEAYRTSPGEQPPYHKWFSDYGCNLFMPLLLKLPGLSGYDWYEDTGLRRRQDVRENEYPRYLSIVYFESIESYENFLKCPELAALQKSMRSVFPGGLNYKWHVLYQLVKSWRK